MDTATRGEVERWFIGRGVPHFIEDYNASTDIWTRATPVLVIAYVAGGLNALDLKRWSWQRNLLVGAAVLAILVATWALANALRGRPALSRPRTIGPPELVLFVLGPALAPAVFGQGGDAFQAVVQGAAVLGVIYLGTSYAVAPLMRWAGQRSFSQLPYLASMVVRALPLLLLFTAFVFMSTEAWQVAGTLYGPPYAIVLAMFFVLGALFVLSRVPSTVKGLATFDSWDEVGELLDHTPLEDEVVPAGQLPDANLTGRQKVNIALVTVFPQALQVTFVGLLITGFFVMFGFLAIPEATTMSWTGLPDVNVLATWRLSHRDLVITEPLLRVSAFLGAFTSMYFTVVLSTDATYREEFAEDVGPQVRQALAVRCAYRTQLTDPSTG